MRDILPTLREWLSTGGTVGLATVIEVRKSAPREPGAAMALNSDGAVIGSVSGGCVEGAVVEVAQRVITSGAPERVSYGISDEEAISVGLTCGGEIELFVEPVDVVKAEIVTAVAEAIATETPIAVATLVDGDGAHGAKLAVRPEGAVGSLGDVGLDTAVTADSLGMLEQASTGLRRYGRTGQRDLDEVTVFVESFAPRPRMYVFGAIDFAGAVARIGRFLGFHVTVCDAREVFATRKRFPDADEIVVDWPHRLLERSPVDARTAVCVLTHDPKFDIPVLEIALRSDAGYVGAMGSRRTHDDRMERLRDRGLTDEELARLRSPIGLDIGSSTPEETAVSIAAELIAVRSGARGLPLRETEGPIHRYGRQPSVAG